MPKISATDSKGLLVKYLIKIICTTVTSIVALSSIISIILLKLDIGLDSVSVITIVLTVISSVIISFISISQFKNNFLLLSCISVSPLAIFVFINFLVNETSPIILLVKLFAVFISAVIVSLIKSMKKR